MTRMADKRPPTKAGTHSGYLFSPGHAPEEASPAATPSEPTAPRQGDPLREHLNLDTSSDVWQTPPPDKHRSDSQADVGGVREQRLPVSLPGLMKILVPEASFTPISLAVRVVNLSANGAMVEVHDRTKLEETNALANRFFELKVAHPEIPVLRGTVAWSDFSRPNPLMGLSTFERLEQFAALILADESTKGMHAPPPLPPPKLQPYPPLVDEPMITLVGEAPEALEVVARGDEKKFTAPVTAGRFELKLELSPTSENHFSLRAYAGQRKSRAVPVRIQYEMRGVQRVPRGFKVEEPQGETDGRKALTIEFGGSVRHAERILYRFSQLMAPCERVSILARLEAIGGFDKRLVDALKHEGIAVGADTSKGKEAERLLDELL